MTESPFWKNTMPKPASIPILCATVLLLFAMPLLVAEEASPGFFKEWTFEPTDVVPGVFGYAKVFPAATPVEVEMDFLPESGTMKQFSISAWIRPTGYERYNEIFRQENDRRILFSLQEDATILSLGLNIGGHVECDAPVDRNAMFDGNWHFVAGTFDGETMRVWLNGREIHQLFRPGKIAVSRNPVGFIGSMNGTQELFQGAIENLQMTDVAYSAEKITELHLLGLAALDKKNEALNREIARFYIKENDLLETILATRKAHAKVKQDGGIDATIDHKTFLAGLDRRLTLDFPDEVKRFLKLTDLQPSQLITANDLGELKAKADAVVRLMVEYLPLTPDQWNFLSPDEKEQWKKVEAVHKSYEQLRFDEAVASIRTLLDVLEAAKSSVKERPVVRERVAPYVTPQTPAPRTYDENQATELIRRDWLHQCNGQPTAERILQEIDWAVALAKRIRLCLIIVQRQCSTGSAVA